MRKASFLDQALVVVMYVLIGFLPIFVLPFSAFVGSSKVVLISVGTLLALLLLIVQNLRDGSILFPRSWLVLSYLGVVLIYIASAIASPYRTLSFLGFAGVDSVYFIIVAGILMYLVSLLTIPRRRLFQILMCLFISATVFAVLQIIFLIAPDMAFVDALRSQNTMLIGSTSDAAIFFGLMSIVALLALELLALERWVRVGAWVVFILSLIMLTIANVALVWYVTGLFALIVFVYSFSTHATKAKALDAAIVRRPYTVPMLPLVLIIICVVCILLGDKSLYRLVGSVPGFAPVNALALNTVEARPSLIATVGIGKDLITHKAFLGAGPGRFREMWNLYRPIEINNTAFWDTDFVVGFSIVASALVTLGILGVLAWLWFIGTYIFLGAKNILRRSDDPRSHSLLVVSCLGGLYLWLFMLIYAPGAPIIALAFIFSGFFLSSLLHERIIPLGKISITEDPRIAFAGVSGLVALLVAVIVVTYVFGTTIISAAYANMASEAYGRGDRNAALLYVDRAINMKDDDGYYRFRTSVGLQRFGELLNAKPNQITKADVERTYQENLATASRATALDGGDYLNWLILAQVYQSITTPKDESAYGEAIKAYTAAQNLNPHNPSIPLAVAQLERAHGDTTKAKAQIGAALTRKPDYTDAYFLLSQILVGEGSLKEAIASAEAATLTAPLNSGVFFQLGLLRYNNKDYAGSINAFERALSLSPDYANVQYFLGLAYDRVGRDEAAIALFEALRKSNPDNQDVVSILANLKAGRSPFSGSESPTTPEKASTLPIKEKR